MFGLNVLNDQQSLSILNMTSKVPKFKVVGLQSEKSFTLTVHSSNLRGRSEQVVLQAQTTKHTLPEPDINQAKIGSLKTRLIISPVLGVLIGSGERDVILLRLVIGQLSPILSSDWLIIGYRSNPGVRSGRSNHSSVHHFVCNNVL